MRGEIFRLQAAWGFEQLRRWSRARWTVSSIYAVSMACICSVEVLVFTSALVTSATDATTIALPARIYGVMGSCRISHPRKTATTGFTYASVETLQVGNWPRSQMSAVNAIQQPQ